jgi:uncharacterized protein with HEPN domain
VIKQYRKTHSNVKILVALNEIDGILKTISHLGELSLCHVLCSSNSHEKIPKVLLNKDFTGKLRRPVTFMTSAFFVGVDVDEECIIIAAGSPTKQHLILTKPKIYQVFGRPRVDDLRVRAFVYQTNKEKSERMEMVQRTLKKLSKDDMKFCKMQINNQLPDISGKNEKKELKLNYAKRSLLDNRKCVYRYMHIDMEILLQIALNRLYKYPKQVFKVFEVSQNKSLVGEASFMELCNPIREEAIMCHEKILEMVHEQDFEMIKLINSHISDTAKITFGFNPLTGTYVSERHKSYYDRLKNLYALIDSFDSEEKPFLLEYISKKVEDKVDINSEKRKSKEVANKKTLIRFDELHERLYYLSMLKDNIVRPTLNNLFILGEAYEASHIIRAIRGIYPDIVTWYPRARNILIEDKTVIRIFNYWYVSKKFYVENSDGSKSKKIQVLAFQSVNSFVKK